MKLYTVQTTKEANSGLGFETLGTILHKPPEQPLGKTDLKLVQFRKDLLWR